MIVRVDLEHGAEHPENAVEADAARLPFGAGAFDAIISNHSLEHFDDLEGALGEIGRVLKSNGALYVAVPDASTVTDRIYRWLARGGGHVNPFTSSLDLAAKIEAATGLRHVGTRTLCTSLSFLNRRMFPARAPRRLWLLGGGMPASLLAMTYGFRVLDRIVGTRLAVYGWALYFGQIGEPIDALVWTNVCIGCGAGAPSEWLAGDPACVRRRFGFRTYRCGLCGTVNLFTDDRAFGHYRAG